MMSALWEWRFLASAIRKVKAQFGGARLCEAQPHRHCCGLQLNESQNSDQPAREEFFGVMNFRDRS